MYWLGAENYTSLCPKRKAWDDDRNGLAIWAGEAQNRDVRKYRLINYQRYFAISAEYSILGGKSPYGFLLVTNQRRYVETHQRRYE